MSLSQLFLNFKVGQLTVDQIIALVNMLGQKRRKWMELGAVDDSSYWILVVTSNANYRGHSGFRDF